MVGAGGMGEVYRASDPELQREVAIKVLPEAAHLSADRLQRFRHEALATAALNHPHVVAVYDAGVDGAGTYVVSELLEGRDLRQILSAGRLSPRKALHYAFQVADGLAAIHEKGIVHRDLKPENLFVTRDDQVKILDFGIARLVEHETSGQTSTGATLPGTILGTIGYMSPEQVRGELVDHRSDIFAFGAVVYEMLTGQRAFERSTGADTLSAILHEEPPAWPGDGTALSIALKRLARRCLEKTAALRFQSARDLAIVLGDASADVRADIAGDPAARPPRISLTTFGVAGASLLAGVLAATLWYRSSAPALPGVRAQPATMNLWLPPGEAWFGAGRTPRLSRDGRRVAALLVRDGIARIHIFDVGTGVWREVPGTEGSTGIEFFSPDGKQVAFIRQNALMRVALDGGATTKICDCGEAMRGGDWGEDNRIVLGLVLKGLAVVPVTGGTPQMLTTPDTAAGETDHRYPIWLPGGKSVLFTVQDRQSNSIGVGAVRLGSNAYTVVVPGGRNALFMDGHLLYTNAADEVNAVRFDVDALEVISAPISLPDRPGGGEKTTDVALRASASDILYLPNVQRLRHFEVMTRDGERRRLPMKPVAVAAPSASPNGERIAFTFTESISNVNVWLYDISADSLTRLTGDGNSRYSRWIDDDRLMFQHRGPVNTVMALTIGGAGRPAADPRPLTNVDSLPMFVDNDAFIFGVIKGQDTDLFRAPVSDTAKGERLLERPGHQRGAELSPDRKWVAYVSDEVTPNVFDLYLASTTALLRPRRLIPGVRGVRWSKAGSDLVFVRNATLFALAIDGTGSPAGEPRRIVDDVSSDDPGLPSFDTLADGRLLLTVDEPRPAVAQMPVLVLNWTARLRDAEVRK